ncbi:MAG: glycosyltransferase family 4 protein [Acidilobus sp.]
MRIALVHTAFFVAGGAERLFLEMYRALKDLGHEVNLYTAYFDEKAWEAATSGMSNIPKPAILGEPAVSRLLHKTQSLRALLAASQLEKPIRELRPRYDLVIETQSNVPLKWADASYIQAFPLAELPEYYLHIERLKLSLHERAYNSLVAWWARSIANKTKPVMTNSSWMAGYVRRAYGSQRVYVVHPPVNVEELPSIGGDRGRIVLTVSRIDWGKRVWEISNIAKLVPDADFYLVGNTGPSSRRILDLIEERSKGLSNFHLVIDVPRRRIFELMSQASVYLHPPVAEGFGMAIAEAAAAGLVPVVYRDGGGWTDIASRVDQGLGYTGIEEAAHIVRSLLNDPGRLKALSARAREVAKGFGYENFKARLSEVINSLSSSLTAR